MARIYLDANVFISYAKMEMGWNIRGLFAESERFFYYATKNKHTLVLSSLFFFEVEKITRMKKEDVINEFKKLGIVVESVLDVHDLHATPYIALGVPRVDAAHVACAILHHCDMIVTFNLKDFELVQSIIPIRAPAMLV